MNGLKKIISGLLVRAETPLLVTQQRWGEFRTRSEKKSYFYIDTNLLGELTKSEAVWRKWNSELLRLGLLNGVTPHYWLTPFLLLEYIGATVPQPPNFKIPKDIVKNNDAYEIGTWLFVEAKKFYESSLELSPGCLRTRAQEQQSFIPKKLLYIYDTLIQPAINDPVFPGQLYLDLAWDYVLKHQYNKETAVRMRYAFPTWYFGAIRKQRDFPGGRFLKTDWNLLYQLNLNKIRTSKEMTPDEKKIAKAEWRQTNRSIDIGTASDFVDIELIQVASTGYVVSGVRRSVHAFTCDLPKKVEHRLAAFQSILKFHTDKVVSDTWQGNPVPGSLLRSGTVYFCNRQTGEIIQTLKVPDAKF